MEKQHYGFRKTRPAFWLLLGCLTGCYESAAQPGSARPDPAFRAQQIYQPASVGSMARTSSGKLVLFGVTRAEGQAVNQIARYDAAGRLDQVFAANTAGYQWRVAGVAPGLNEETLVDLPNVCQLGGTVTRTGLTRLLADGRLDATFQPQPPVSASAILVQPDGKTLVGGWFGSYGSSGASGLVRLNLDGSIDQAFSARLGAGFTGNAGNVRVLALQPDGRIVVGGDFATVAGQPQPLLARLEASGAPDRSFAPPTQATGRVNALALQPDGRILASATGGFLLRNATQALVRLLPSGQHDASFAPYYSLTPFDERSGAHTIQVQPDGRIILAGQGQSQAAWQAGYRNLFRLLPNGGFDPAWSFVDYGPSGPGASSLVLLPNGQLVVGGFPRRYRSATSTVTGIAVLDPNGVPAAGFQPRIQAPGAVADVVEQADHRLVLVGNFDEVNGVSASRLARLSATGEVDTAFTARARLGWSEMGQNTRLLVQADGKIIIGGDFATANGQPRPALARLLPDGRLDAAYAPALPPGSLLSGNVFDLDAAGRLLINSFAINGLARLTPSGQFDASFVPAWGTYATAARVQPDGRIVVGEAAEVRRLLPTGALDPSFALVQLAGGIGGGQPRVEGIVRYPDGRLLLHGDFARLGTVTSPGIGRVSATGTPDRGFASALNTPIGASVNAAVLQPNQRVLVTGLLLPATTQSAPVLARLMPAGALDPTLNVNIDGFPRCLTMLADGALVLGGGFGTVAGQPHMGLVRLLAPNVLGTQRAVSDVALEVWPVPARDQVQLSCEATAQPLRATLRDALGRTVRTVPFAAPSLTLATADLARGFYHLQVEFANARPVVRRIALE